MREVIRRLRRSSTDERGTSLAELVVGMGVMVVFMTIFTGAVVSLARTTTKVEAVSTSAASVSNAFLALDKRVRYAEAITTIGRATGGSGDWYVELDSVNNDTAKETCTQLRVDIAKSQLQQRTWTAVDATHYSDLSADWTLPSSTGTVLASNISNGAAAAGTADQPFTTPAVLTTASSSFQRLGVTLVAGTSGPSSTSTTRSTVAFTALNSLAADSTNAAKCQQLPSGSYRP
jgi:hypothetical protein